MEWHGLGFESMKTFLKRSSIVCGVLFFAMICLGIVYIDTTQNYWRYQNGEINLTVSNQVVMRINTNNMRLALIERNSLSRGVTILGAFLSTNTSGGNGANMTTAGSVGISGSVGQYTDDATSARGGSAGGITIVGGVGGEAYAAKIDVFAAAGGTLTLNGGSGGGVNSVATNSIAGGGGGSILSSAGSGASPNFAATNTVGGDGGAVNYAGGAGGAPSAGWARATGSGGQISLIAGNAGATAIRTNAGNGGLVQLIAGNAGAVGTATGNAGASGIVTITAGNGANGTGGTNSDGGNIFLRGGTPGTAAVPGNVIVGRNSSGAGNGGGLVVGISNSAIVTNIIFVRTNLDFPSTLTGASSDLVAVAITGRTNAIVNVGPPPSALVSGGFYSGFCSNGIVFVRFAFIGAVSADPAVGDFEVEIKAYR